MKTMLVKSPNEKGVHLTDSTVRDDKGEFFHCSISNDEAKKGKAVKVPDNGTFHGYIKLGYLVTAEETVKAVNEPKKQETKKASVKEVSDEKN